MKALRLVIKQPTAISVDATKVREGKSELKADGNKELAHTLARCQGRSDLWDPRGRRRQEAVCGASTYVRGITHADLFFKRLTVEMNR